MDPSTNWAPGTLALEDCECLDDLVWLIMGQRTITDARSQCIKLPEQSSFNLRLLKIRMILWYVASQQSQVDAQTDKMAELVQCPQSYQLYTRLLLHDIHIHHLGYRSSHLVS